MDKHTKKTRTTIQRKVILEELAKMNTHPQATELYEIVKKRLPYISLSTVYRNLDRLSTEGLVLKLKSGEGPAHYDGRSRPHYHIKCINCNKVNDVTIKHNTTFDKTVEKICGYKRVTHTIEFFGICPDCEIKNND